MSRLNYPHGMDSFVNVESAFDLWSEVYDTQLNPLLMLEERSVLPLLPSLTNGNVLDAGCGTGRWLVRLEDLNPASLMGTDASLAMLARCRKKVSLPTRLHLSHCSVLPVSTASQTLILSSFVLSYLDNLASFADECARAIRPGGTLILSDMHPETAEDRGWKRSFRINEATLSRTVDLDFVQRPLHEIVSIFKDRGFALTCRLEPCFGVPEQIAFEAAGMLADFDSLAAVPSIYILKFERTQKKLQLVAKASAENLQLTRCSYAAGPSTWRSGIVEIKGDRIASLDSKEEAVNLTLDLSGYSVLPGLINIHEHLDLGLFPRLGRSAEVAPYRNATEWAAEIHVLHADTIRKHQSIPKNTRFWWGAIRNLLCGVTTVCHHNPLYENLQRSEFPIRMAARFGWAHSLAFDPYLSQKFEDTPKAIPFILHAAEGIDSAAQEEILHLDNANLLDDRTVLIHGLGITPEALSLMNRRGAALVVCPTSAQFLFGRVLSHDLLSAVRKLAIGSDSSLTAAGDLLDEVAFLRSNFSISEIALYHMITTNPANYLRLENEEGRICEGGMADMIAVNGQQLTPAAALSRLTVDQVELVIISGRVQLASEAIYNRLPLTLRIGMEALDLSGTRRWIRAPLQELFDSAEEILGKGNLFVSGRQVQYAGTL
jgi:cytosine/adenosine deaminase-related metal-dependent hydrolase/ubiquinone/menaquinone biosynthesis C-methylase UbiE